MAMKRRKVDSSRERRVLISLITSKRYLAKASKLIDLELIEAPHFKQVATWCLDYFKEYRKAPGEAIEDLYHKWSEGNQNKELGEAVSEFLDGLSKEYAQGRSTKNIPFLVDELAELMGTRRLQQLKGDLEYSLMKGNRVEAQKAVTQFRIDLEAEHTGKEWSPNKKGAFKAAFSAAHKPIIELEGDRGTFFNAALIREGLLAIQGTEKRGKTHHLLEFAVQALRQRKKVAFFQAGDLSREELAQRLAIRWARLPLLRSQLASIMIPKKIRFDENNPNGYEVISGDHDHENVVDREAAEKGWRAFARAHGLHGDVDYLKTSSHMTGTLNVSDIDSILDAWRMQEDFIPDLIIIDYADILAPEESKRRYEHDRNVINDTWKTMRRLAQKRRALVITATQASAKAYNQRTQTMASFGEDKRKMAHVTGMFALNQTAEEKEMNGMRLNWIVLRGAPFNTLKPLYIGTCYALSRAMTVSRLAETKKSTVKIGTRKGKR